MISQSDSGVPVCDFAKLGQVGMDSNQLGLGTLTKAERSACDLIYAKSEVVGEVVK